MPLDVDRLASETLALTKALLGKEIAPLREDLVALRRSNDELRAENAALIERLVAVEARPVPDPKADPAETAGLIKGLIDGAVSQAVVGIQARDVAPCLADLQSRVADAIASIPEVRDGKDADPEQMRAMVEEAVAALPKPQDGKSVEIKDVESLLAEMVAALPIPRDGKDADVEEIRSLVADAVGSAVEALPKPVTPDLSQFVTLGEFAGLKATLPVPKDYSAEIAAVASQVSEVRAAVDGIEFPSVPDVSGFATKEELREAVDNVPRAELPDMSDFATKEEVAALRAEVPTILEPKDWSCEIKAAVDSIQIPEPIPGKPGRGIKSVRVNDDGELVVKWVDDETDNLGRVTGRDGFGFEDMSAEWDGERTLTFRWSKGDRIEEKVIRLPVMIYRDVWREGSYERGDSVTWAGSAWVAQEDTDEKPGVGKAWRLAVKRGRDAKQPVAS